MSRKREKCDVRCGVHVVWCGPGGAQLTTQRPPPLQFTPEVLLRILRKTYRGVGKCSESEILTPYHYISRMHGMRQKRRSRAGRRVDTQHSPKPNTRLYKGISYLLAFH